MNSIKCLDHGYIKLLNISGAIPRPEQEFNSSDIDPAKCARISFDNFDKTRTKEQDLRLVEYLLKNRHSSPFEMTTLWFEIKLPIFIARQFHRHRMQSINEVSGRYVILPHEFYIPNVIGGKATSAKQGQEDNLSFATQELVKRTLKTVCDSSYKEYRYAINLGVAPEHARLFLHLNHYTHYVFKIDLHNTMHFLDLRLGEHAQYEAKVYAQAMYDLISQVLPETMKLYDKRHTKVKTNESNIQIWLKRQRDKFSGRLFNA